jgi:DNA-binding NarL/FixJ family response regulator
LTQGPRIVIGEDETLMRHGLQLILERSGFHVLAAARDGRALVEATEQHHPELVVTDIRMPPTHRDEGLQATREIKSRWPEIGVMMLSHHAQRGIAVDLVRNYATGIGYLLKQRVADVDQFTHDLHAVAGGRTVMDPEVVTLLMSGAPAGSIQSLTERQRRVLGLMARGFSNAAIAQELHVSEKSVIHYVSEIYKALRLPVTADAHRRVQAVIRFLVDAQQADQ